MGNIIFFLVLSLAALMLQPAESAAVPYDREMRWKTTMGEVVVPGRVHADRGVKCAECHPKIFQQKKGASHFIMDDIKMGNFCGRCHNGKRAFSATSGKNCYRCHKR